MSAKHRYAAAWRLAVVFAAGGVLAAVATGCAGGGDDPPPTSSTSSTASATASGTSSSPPSSTPPATSSGTSDAAATTTTAVQIPEAARAHTEAGAEAFVRFFMEQANAAWVQPNASLLPPLSDAGCLSCKDIQATALSLVNNGEHYLSDPVTVTAVTAFGGAPKGQQYVRLFMTQH